MTTGAGAQRATIERLIPHQGSMCLLDEATRWDEHTIECRTATHRDPANPLRSEGRLAAIHLVEYGAQAMAVHGGLLARERGEVASPGLLVAVRDVKLWVDRVDDIEGDLTVRAKKLVANAGGWLYSFEVESAGRMLASGRVGVIPPRS